MKNILLSKTSIFVLVLILISVLGASLLKGFSSKTTAWETPQFKSTGTSLAVNTQIITSTKIPYQILLSPSFNNWWNASDPDLVESISFDSDGNLWTSSMFAIVYWNLKEAQYQPYVLGGCPGDYINDLLFESSSSAWASTDHGLWHFDGKVWKQNIAGTGFGTLALSSNSGIWAVGNGNELYHFQADTWEKYDSNFPKNDEIPLFRFISMAVDQNDQVWVNLIQQKIEGPNNLGVWSFDKTSWEHVTEFPEKMLSSYSLTEDALGRIWVVEPNNPFENYKGSISMFDGSKWQTFPIDILHVTSIATDSKSFLWITSGSELYRFDGLQLEKYPLPKIDAVILDIAISKSDNICLGTQGEGVWCEQNNQWQNYKVEKIFCP